MKCRMQMETERLILRRWEEPDADALYRYASDPRVGPAAGWPVHTSVADSRNIIHTALSGAETYAICLKETGEPVGSIGLDIGSESSHTWSETEAEIGYWIGVPFWGMGYVPEAVRELQRHAFCDLGLTQLWCGYYAGNDKSRRVQEKCGFTYHHTLENCPVPLLNEVRTELITTLSREDWEGMQR